MPALNIPLLRLFFRANMVTAFAIRPAGRACNTFSIAPRAGFHARAGRRIGESGGGMVN